MFILYMFACQPLTRKVVGVNGVSKGALGGGLHGEDHIGGGLLQNATLEEDAFSRQTRKAARLKERLNWWEKFGNCRYLG